MIRKPQTNGFTLIEVLIALFIFAILSTIVAIGLRTVIHVYKHVSKKQEALQRLSMAETLLRQDVTQIVMRSVRNASGHQEPPLMSTNKGFVFTRAGVINPFDIYPRSDLERIGYILEDHQLIRLVWPSLDQVINEKPAQKVLLTNVTNMSIRFIDTRGQSSSEWPLAFGSNQQVLAQAVLPKAIELTLSLKNQVRLKFLFPVISGRKYE